MQAVVPHSRRIEGEKGSQCLSYEGGKERAKKKKHERGTADRRGFNCGPALASWSPPPFFPTLLHGVRCFGLFASSFRVSPLATPARYAMLFTFPNSLPLSASLGTNAARAPAARTPPPQVSAGSDAVFSCYCFDVESVTRRPLPFPSPLFPEDESVHCRHAV